MAKVVRRVGATSGQGVSRRAYQTAYGLGQRGTGPAGGGVKPPTGQTGTGSGSVRTYSKSKVDNGGSFNIAYSDREFKTPSLDALNKLPAGPGKKGTKGFI